MNDFIPEYIKHILSQIQANGYEAYIVGGAVRDLLLGRQAKDFDIVTAARPEQIVEIAEICCWQTVKELGRNFGTVVLVVAGHVVEVATFRGGRQRRDDQQAFGNSLGADLARRDFTINATAMDLAGRIIDPFNGRKDLANKVIRAVGKAEERFAEDGLRMFRACRFAAELGFAVDDEIMRAIGNHLATANVPALERVREEIKRILLAPWPQRGLSLLVVSGLADMACNIKENGQYRPVAILPELPRLVGLGQNPRYHNWDVWEHTLRTVAAAPPDYVLRWAALLHDAGKGLPGVRGKDGAGQPTDHGHDKAGAIIAADVLARFRLPEKMRKRVVWLVDRHMRFYAYAGEDRDSLTRWVRREARSGEFRNTADLVDAFQRLTKLCEADCQAAGGICQAADMAIYSTILLKTAQRMPVHTTDIEYDKDELVAELGEARVLGIFLPYARRRIQDGTLANARQDIRLAARKWLARRGKT